MHMAKSIERIDDVAAVVRGRLDTLRYQRRQAERNGNADDAAACVTVILQQRALAHAIEIEQEVRSIKLGLKSNQFQGDFLHGYIARAGMLSHINKLRDDLQHLHPGLVSYVTSLQD